jgi:hypothetical protein
MKRIMGALAVVCLAGLFPLVQAQEEAKPEEKPRGEAAQAPDEGARMLERFDLNKDGRVTWEEFQKVRTGFTRLDADGDGVLTRADVKQLKQRHAAQRGERREGRARAGRRGRYPRGRGQGQGQGRGQGRRADCDCACHKDRAQFRGPPRHDGPRGFRGRGRGGWDRPGREDFGPGRGPGPGGRGWGRREDDRPR